MVANGPRPAPGRCGLAETDPDDVGREVLLCWDGFLDVVRAGSTDLARPSRVKGWSGKDLLVHLGDWPDSRVLTALLESAAEGGHGVRPSPGEGNEALVAAHRADTPEQVIEALVAARDRIAQFFTDGEAHTWGRMLSRSDAGPLPTLSLVHAGTFELAVHAMDLAPCGAPPPSAQLLDRGLAALLDVTGSLAAGSAIDIEVTGQTPSGGWAFGSGVDGWTTTRVPPGPFDGVGVQGSAADLLDTAAGRTNLGQLLLTRRLQVQHLPQWMRLAPLLDDVPGLPGGAALKTAAGGLSGVAGGLSGVAGGVGRALGRFRR